MVNTLIPLVGSEFDDEARRIQFVQQKAKIDMNRIERNLIDKRKLSKMTNLLNVHKTSNLLRPHVSTNLLEPQKKR